MIAYLTSNLLEFVPPVSSSSEPCLSLLVIRKTKPRKPVTLFIQLNRLV